MSGCPFCEKCRVMLKITDDPERLERWRITLENHIQQEHLLISGQACITCESKKRLIVEARNFGDVAWAEQLERELAAHQEVAHATGLAARLFAGQIVRVA